MHAVIQLTHHLYRKMASRKIVVFLGTTREGRFGDKVAKYVNRTLQNTGVSVKLFGKKISLPSQNLCYISNIYVSDPLDMDFQTVRQPLHFMKDQSAAPSWLVEANEEIKTADGFVVVLSEYNCGIPPALSGLMDLFPPTSYRHKPCSIVTYSMGMIVTLHHWPKY